MGKKNKSNSLGRALIKDRFSKRRNKGQDSLLHTAELNDGYDWGRLNLQSVTEQSSFEEFLSTAQLAGTEFQAEKLNVKFVNPNTVIKGATREEREKFEKTRQEKQKFIRIPRRPKWDSSTTKEELDSLEREVFLDWRRNLALIQERDNLTLTPYEKNIEFWRQLWRVVERSNVVVQIVDARNPLLFRCEDLEDYTLDLGKRNLLLVNKADLLSKGQRATWAKWFAGHNVEAVFFSATQAALEEIEETDEEYHDAEDQEEQEQENKEEYVEASENVSSGSDDDWSDYSGSDDDEDYIDASGEEDTDDDSHILSDKCVAKQQISQPPPRPPRQPILHGKWKAASTSGKLLGRMELISLFHSLRKDDEDCVTIGLVGYPNVGKSSTINTLMAAKKVSVSATPGKTKHFQTLFLEKDLVLCDCPGLVMPSVAHSKSWLVLAGVLPPDSGGDLHEPVGLLASLLGRSALQRAYGLVIPPPPEGEPHDRPPTAIEFLSPYAYSRGFMTSGGRPDTSRAARYVVKDFTSGKLIYATAPPGTSQEEFEKLDESKAQKEKQTLYIAPRILKASQRTKSQGLDQAFFQKASLGAHTKGISKIPSTSCEAGSVKAEKGKSKPWKDHSEKRNKREKLRRVYRHLDVTD